jgi:hypothetical protein
MVVLRGGGVPDPPAPAGAATLLVSLGLLRTAAQLLLAAAVLLLTVLDWLFNRIIGEPVPVWRAR